MILEWKHATLVPRHPFAIARGVSTAFERVFVSIRHGDFCGLGEAAPSARYGESAGTVILALERIAPGLGDDPLLIASELARARGASPGAASALAAVDIALHDLAGRILDLPLHRMLGLEAGPLPPTSMTIALGSPHDMLARAREARDFTSLKVKVGQEGDMRILRCLRAETPQPFRVDANEGWSAAEAIERVSELGELGGVEWVEQPCPAADLDGLARVTEASPIPVLGDECCAGVGDVHRVAGAVHGIVIKLAKCGGIREAICMMRIARELELRVVIGCMVESSLGITAAAHLGAAADALDLDGHLLIENDPFKGVTAKAGRLVLPGLAGIGARPC